MKRFIFSFVVVLLATLTFSGCKESSVPVLFSASENIFGSWESLYDVDVGDAVILAGAEFYIEDIEGYWADLYYDADIGEEVDEPCNWDGEITPDPTTSAYLSILVDYTEGVASPETGDTVSMIYNMTSTDTAIFYLDGNAFSVVRFFED